MDVFLYYYLCVIFTRVGLEFGQVFVKIVQMYSFLHKAKPTSVAQLLVLNA